MWGDDDDVDEDDDDDDVDDDDDDWGCYNGAGNKSFAVEICRKISDMWSSAFDGLCFIAHLSHVSGWNEQTKWIRW